MLSYQEWRQTKPPALNGGTDKNNNEVARVLSRNNRKEADQHVLLSSQKWHQTKPPAPNGGTGKNNNEAARVFSRNNRKEAEHES